MYFPTLFHGIRIRAQRMNGHDCFCMYDLGKALGYDVPGNLSRNVAHVQAWRESLEEGKDFHREGFGARGRIWLTRRGVRNVCRLVISLDRPDRAALADELLIRWAINERHKVAQAG
jgi:hypothetical protein